MPFNHLWEVHEDSFEPQRLRHSETIFTSGNGYLGTRGAFEESYPDEQRATFIHGVFDDVPIALTELANAPDWLELDILLDGERFYLTSGQILSYSRYLDLKTGILSRQVTWCSPQGKTVALAFERFPSLGNPHLMAIQFKVKSVDFSGQVEVRAGASGYTDNQGLLHWVWLDQYTGTGEAGLHVRTRASHVELSLFFRLYLHSTSEIKSTSWNVNNHPTVVATAFIEPGQEVSGEKLVAIYTSRDSSNPSEAARLALKNLSSPAYPQLHQAQIAAWAKEWQACDMSIEGDDEAQISIRFNLFHLLIAAPRGDEGVNIGAKTLSGFGYRGHSFWDTEIFMLPFFTYTRPEIAHNLLSYRFHNLPGARKKAQGNGFKGAQYPWESAGTGVEVTPTWVPHQTDHTRMVRIWTGDIEIHISADIAYALWRYWQVTGDDGFMIERGARIVFETAQFWASRAEWNETAGYYEYNDVIGPDENHDRINNNAYTNYLVRWHLLNALSFLDWLKAHAPEAASHWIKELNLDKNELAFWQTVSDKLYCAYDPQTHLIEQFSGYFQRLNVTCADYEPRTLSVQALLGIDEAAATQIIKQPDVLMLFYLLPDLADETTLKANYAYYTPRTDLTLGSSLGPSIQAIMACRVGDLENAYENFIRAARADLHDVRGNAGDGIHGASAGGMWQAAVFGFAGLQITPEGLKLSPQLPSGWEKVIFTIKHHGIAYKIEITPEYQSIQEVR